MRWSVRAPVTPPPAPIRLKRCLATPVSVTALRSTAPASPPANSSSSRAARRQNCRARPISFTRRASWRRLPYQSPRPPILWHGDEPQFFDRPYFVGEFIEGFKLSEQPLLPADLARLARIGIATMADLHAVPWASRREVFGDPVLLIDEMKRLDNLSTVRPSIPPSSPAAPNCASACEPRCPPTHASDASTATSNGPISCSITSARLPSSTGKSR